MTPNKRHSQIQIHSESSNSIGSDLSCNEKNKASPVLRQAATSSSTLESHSIDQQSHSELEPVDAKSPTQCQKAIQLLASFVPFISSWGLVSSYGVFQAAYSSRTPPLASDSNISWVGSIQAFLLCFGAVLVGPAIDAGYVRAVLLAGTLLVGGAMIVLSWCTEFYQVMLAQGIMVGLGTGCLFLPSVTLLPVWFSPQSRTTALAAATTGSCFGSVVTPIVFHYIEQSAGFGWATRTIGFITLGTNIFPILFMRYRELPKERRSLVDLSMLKEKHFLVLCVSYWFAMVSILIPIFYLQVYAATEQLVSTSLLFWVIPIAMAASFPGRVLPALIAQRIGNLNVMIVMTAMTSTVTFSWISVHSTASMMIIAILFGFSFGSFVALLVPTVISTAPNMKHLATRVGMSMLSLALGVLIGTPVAGAILTDTGMFLDMQIFAGLLSAISVVFMLLLRYLKVGWAVLAKV